MATLQQDLSRDCQLLETHISWVFRRESEVIKVKKPVNLGFLDFSSVEKRHSACQAELELNRRLSPSVYLGVVPVTRNAQGLHAVEGEGEIVDWAVRMRRLPDEQRADLRLTEGRLSQGQLDGIVTRLAKFHAALGPSSESEVYGGARSVAENIEENFEQTTELLPRYLNGDEIQKLLGWQRDFVAKHANQFESRRKEGRVREGHGDLRLEHIYLSDEGSIEVLDCIEFNQRFRIADVCADIVFLAMDLASHGRADLAERCLAVYARESNDFDLYAVADFYESYRAFVRGKISAFVAEGSVMDTRVQERAAKEARRHFLLALASESRNVLPRTVVAVGGIIASGKSTVARSLAEAMSAPVVNADRTRKYLAGIDPRCPVDAAAFDGMYSLEFTETTYREVARRAEQVLRSGRPVVLDASFRARWMRDLVKEMADSCGASFVFVECKVDEQTCLDRLDARDKARGVSDGRKEIFQDFVDKWEPVTELSSSEHLVIDTSLSLQDNMQKLRTVLATWPAGLYGP